MGNSLNPLSSCLPQPTQPGTERTGNDETSKLYIFSIIFYFVFDKQLIFYIEYIKRKGNINLLNIEKTI